MYFVAYATVKQELLISEEWVDGVEEGLLVHAGVQHDVGVDRVLEAQRLQEVIEPRVVHTGIVCPLEQVGQLAEEASSQDPVPHVDVLLQHLLRQLE